MRPLEVVGQSGCVMVQGISEEQCEKRSSLY